MALLFLPEKSAGRATFNSEVCEDMERGAVDAGGAGPAVGAGDSGSGGCYMDCVT